MIKFDFNWINDDLELRISKGGNDKIMPELVKWDSEHSYCWTLCYWEKTSEGYELKFVGSRPFDNISFFDIEKVWSALKSMDDALKGLFEMEDIDED